MKIRLFSAVAALTFAGAHAASAQSIDYGSLQQLFNEPVTTSATGSPLRATEVPADMTIITAEDIQHSGATDLPTILSRVAGVDVLSWSAGSADIGIRGYDQIDSPRLLVLINGREVYLDDYGYTAWSTLPVELSEIRQIEVVRGPNSALFGFNAAGGVINIITYNPKYDNTNTIEVHGGTQNDAGGSGVTTLRLGDKLSMRVSAGGERQDQWKNTSNYPAPWNAHGMFDGVAELNSTTDLRIQGSLSRAAQEDVLPSDTYIAATYTTKSLMGTLTSDTSYGQIQAQAYLNGLEFQTSNTGSFDLKNQVEVVSLQDLLKVDARSTVRVALEYRNNLVNTNPLNTGHIGYSVWAPSAMWNFAATSKLSITAAGRVDELGLYRSGTIPAGFPMTVSDWNRTISTFSANLGAVYKVTDLDTVRATYARGIQTPSLIQMGAVQTAIGPAPYGINLAGNPNLEPTVVTNYELSYDRALPALGASASAKVFYQQTDDVQGQYGSTPSILRTATTSATILYENASNSDMVGFELSAKGKIKGGFHWSADTTYTDITDTAINGYSLVGRQVDFSKTSPKFRGNAAAGWTGGDWSVDGFVHYVTQYDTYLATGGLISSPAYASFDARIAYQLPAGMVVAVSGQNLATDRQIQAGALYLRAPRRALISLSKAW